MTDKPQEFIALIPAGPAVLGIARDPDGATRVGIKGNLVTQNRDDLKTVVTDQIRAGHTTLVLDLRQCGYIDAVGLGVIVSIARKAEQAGGSFTVEGLNEDLVTLFAITKLDKCLTIRPAAEAKP